MYGNLGRKITNEEFDFRIKDSNFRRITDYVNSKTVILFECIICNKKFKKKPKDFNKLSCKCVKNRNIYLNYISEKNIELIDPYVSVRSKAKHRCLSCGLIFLTSPKSIKSSIIGCPSCSGKIFSIDKYKSLLPSNIILESSVYSGSAVKIKHKCVDCNNIWETKPNYIIHMGCGCPKCAFSKGEKEIISILDGIGIEYIKQKTVEILNKKYRFDFYIPTLNLYIEYDGIQHFKPIEYFGGEESFDKIKNSDSVKNNWVNENVGDILLRISYLDDVKHKLLEYMV